MSYICLICDTPFDPPARHKTVDVFEGWPSASTEELCPICASPIFAEADTCRCGNAKLTTDVLCLPCRQELKRRFCAFADALTAEEEMQLDNWLDGDTIQNRTKWN